MIECVLPFVLDGASIKEGIEQVEGTGGLILGDQMASTTNGCEGEALMLHGKSADLLSIRVNEPWVSVVDNWKGELGDPLVGSGGWDDCVGVARVNENTEILGG
eukprot:GDKJ01049111.1.p2 GENE.GDKJ01049111.1~~GDKJ01049111.1.p2  ORF type:complete len:104 (-),score=15.07 GDKJ01049111.1:154-465(-)